MPPPAADGQTPASHPPAVLQLTGVQTGPTTELHGAEPTHLEKPVRGGAYVRSMARHHIWEPGPDDATLLEWYEPLCSSAAGPRRAHPLARAGGGLRAGPAGRPPRARHGCGPTATAGTGGELHVDDAGATYAYRPHPSAGAGGRFVATPIRRAVYAAELHRQPEDLWYEFPGERRQQQAAYAGALRARRRARGPRPRPARAPTPPAAARHLVLVPSSGD